MPSDFLLVKERLGDPFALVIDDVAMLDVAVERLVITEHDLKQHLKWIYKNPDKVILQGLYGNPDLAFWPLLELLIPLHQKLADEGNVLDGPDYMARLESAYRASSQSGKPIDCLDFFGFGGGIQEPKVFSNSTTIEDGIPKDLPRRFATDLLTGTSAARWREIHRKSALILAIRP